jgi:hypothetical protein
MFVGKALICVVTGFLGYIIIMNSKLEN